MSQYSRYPALEAGSASWKTSVANAAALPLTGNNAGDARATQNTGIVYVWDGSAWIPQSGGAFVGSPNTIAGFDGAGSLQSIPGFNIGSDAGGLNLQLTAQPNNFVGGKIANNLNLMIDPIQSSPNETWTANFIQADLDLNSTGFNIGTAGNAVNLISNQIRHKGTSNVGSLTALNNYFDLGNGVDAIDVKGISYGFGFANINAGVTMSGPVQGWGFQPNFDAASILTSYITPFYDFSTVPIAVDGFNSFSSGPSILSVNNNTGGNSFSSNPTITTFTGNSGYTSFGAYGQYGTLNSGAIKGVGVYPTVTLNKGYVAGIDVDVSNVTNYPGVQSTLTIQDITYTFIQAGDNNSYQIEYLDDVTAGSESFTILGQLITCHMESGVSTATQIAAAAATNFGFISSVNVTITGVGSNAQLAVSATNFINGEQPGVKKAANFNGDVSINGNLSFNGALNLGQITSFAPYTILNGTGVPQSVDTLVTSPSVPASAVLTNADLFGVNNAMLLNVGAGASVSTTFLGIAAVGLPAVVTLGAGATVDSISGAIFAISLDAAAGGGTIDTVSLCKSLAIPNGITTINKLRAFEMALPFGDPGTVTHGIYIGAPTAHNYLERDLKVGGASNVPANNNVGIELDSTSKAILLSRMTTTERDAMTPIAGMLIFNTTTSKFQGYDGSVWADLN